MKNFAIELKRLLKDAGFEFFRAGRGDHEIWRHRETGKRVTVDGKIPSRHWANSVLKQAGLPKAF